MAYGPAKKAEPVPPHGALICPSAPPWKSGLRRRGRLFDERQDEGKKYPSQTALTVRGAPAGVRDGDASFGVTRHYGVAHESLKCIRAANLSCWNTFTYPGHAPPLNPAAH